MKKRFVVEFEDGSAEATGQKHDRISMSYSGEELIRCFEVGGVPFISGNAAGLVKLGELFIQLGKSRYKSGFHLHIQEDFCADKKEIVIIGVQNSN